MRILKKHICLKTTFSTFVIVFILFLFLFAIYQFGLPGTTFKGHIRSRKNAQYTFLMHISSMERNRINLWFNEIIHDLDEILHPVFDIPFDSSESIGAFINVMKNDRQVKRQFNVYFELHPYCLCLQLFDPSSRLFQQSGSTFPACTSVITTGQNLFSSNGKTHPCKENDQFWMIRKNYSAGNRSGISAALLVDTKDLFGDLHTFNKDKRGNSLLCIVSEHGVYPQTIDSTVHRFSSSQLRMQHFNSVKPFTFRDSITWKKWRITLQPLEIGNETPTYLAILTDLDAFNRTTINDLFFSLLFAFIGALCATLILGINLRIHIRYLLKLHKTVEEIQNGNQDARVEIDTADEIGSLASAFNTMLDKYSSLQHSLENSIRERTTSLEETNRRLEEQLHFQQFLTSLSESFLLSEPKTAVKIVNDMVSCIRKYFTFDFCFLYTRTDDSQFMLREQSVRPQIPLPLFPQMTTLLNNIAVNLLSGESVICSSLEDDFFRRLPDERKFFKKVGIHSFIAVPLIVRESISGALITGNTQPTDWNGLTPEKLHLCGAFTIGALLRHQFEQDLLISKDRLQTLTLESAKAEEKQRDLIATWIHDSIGQELALIKMQLGMIATEISEAEYKKDLSGIRTTVDRIIGECREKVFDLSPPLLREFGLPQTLSWFCTDISDKNQISSQLTVNEPFPVLPYELAVLLFRCTRELVINVLKHAEANRFQVQCISSDQFLKISVTDNGKGIPENVSYGYGLLSIQERISDLGGNLTISCLPCGGTIAEITVPPAVDTTVFIHATPSTKEVPSP